MNFIYGFITVFILMFSLPVDADEYPEASKKDQKIIRMTLSNGMRVVLKKTDFDSDEILIRLQAKGGFTSLPIEQRAAAMIAPQVAKDSNFSSIPSNMLSDEDIDFDIEIMPYFRGIQGYCVPGEFDTLLGDIKKMFSAPELSKSAFDSILLQAKKMSVRNSMDFDEIFQNAFISINTQNFPWLKNLNPQELEQVNLKTCEELYNAFFSDPSDFIAVIVGNFDMRTIKAKIETWLASIPHKSKSLDFNHAAISVPPSKTIIKEIIGTGEKNSLARFNLSFNSRIGLEDHLKIKLVSLFVEEQLQEAIKKIYNKDIGLEVVPTLAAYPNLDTSWIYIQFRIDFSMISKIKALILGELEKIFRDGIDEEELTEFKDRLRQEDEFWLRDNQYWVMHLLDYVFWEWPITDTFGSCKELEKFDAKELNAFIRGHLSLSNHTFIYSKPG